MIRRTIAGRVEALEDRNGSDAALSHTIRDAVAALPKESRGALEALLGNIGDRALTPTEKAAVREILARD